MILSPYKFKDVKMTAILENFVTVRTTRGDVLNPTEFRSIVEMVKGLMIDEVIDITNGINGFESHTFNLQDPHNDSEALYPTILENIYSIYQYMTYTPLSYTDFVNTLVPTTQFIELVRRILLNRYIYNQVKNGDGSVPYSAPVMLTKEWGNYANSEVPVTYYFSRYLGIFTESGLGIVTESGIPLGIEGGETISTESEFISIGLSGSVAPYPIIFNASDLTTNISTIPITFHTSSAASYYNPVDTGNGYTQPLSLSSTAVSIDLWVVGTPTSTKTILTLNTGLGTVILSMHTDNSMTLSSGGTSLTPSILANGDGRICISFPISGDGEVAVSSGNNLTTSTLTRPSVMSQPVSSIALGISLEDLTTTNLGIRSLTVYDGYRQLF